MPWFTGLLLLMYCQHVHVDFDMKFASILLNVETFNMLFCGKANMSMLNFRCGARLPFLTKWIKIETISSDLVRYTQDQESQFFHLIHCSPFVLRSTPSQQLTSNSSYGCISSHFLSPMYLFPPLKIHRISPFKCLESQFILVQAFNPSTQEAKAVDL